MYRSTVLQAASRPVLPRFVDFREYFPLTLKNSLSGKEEWRQGGGCVHEISLLLSCLRDSEYSESVCAKELNVYRNCVGQEQAARAKTKEAMKSGRLTGDGNTLTYQQLNRTFADWPQPGVKTGRSQRRPPNMSYSDPTLRK